MPAKSVKSVKVEGGSAEVIPAVVEKTVVTSNKQESDVEVEDTNEVKNNTGVFTGRMKQKPELGKFFLDIMNALANEFDGIPVEEFISFIAGMNREDVEKMVKKSNKRKVSNDAKFVAKDLKKPVNAINLFSQKLKAECEKNNVKFTLELRNKKWNDLSEKEKNVFKNQYEKSQEEYKKNYAKQMEQAIKKGEFPEPKPKRGLTPYFHFLADVRPMLTEKFAVSDEDAKNMTNEELKEARKQTMKDIGREAGEMWKNLDEKKKAKYNNLAQKDKEEYMKKEAEWKLRDVERRRKLGQATENETVKIESSQPKEEIKESKIVEEVNKEVEKKSTKKLSTPAQSEDEDDTPKKTITKKQSNKKPTKVVSEDEE